MSLPARQRQLDALLHAFRELWHPQPFRQSRPVWCARWPALTAELLALSEAEMIRLNDDAASALALLARHVPEVAEVAALIVLPARQGVPLPARNSRWAWEIPGRKQQQIEAFAATAQSAGQPVLDWCGGKGHLGRLLAQQWAVPVHTLEIDPLLCAEGESLAARQGIGQEFVVSDALTAGSWPKPGQHAVALHACGELHRRLIERGVGAGVSRFDVAPCCYYRGVNEAYQPMSGRLQTQLMRDDTRLAVTETVTASPRLARQRDKEMAWKLGFSAWRQHRLAGDYQNFKPVPAAWFRGSYAEFLESMAARQGLSSPAPADAAHFEAVGWVRQREVMRLSVVRHAFRRALEIWLALDLAVFLTQQDYVVEFGSFCERRLTPRNLLISAWRG